MTTLGLTRRGFALTLLTFFCTQCRTPGSREVRSRFSRPADDTCRTELTEFVSAELHGQVVLTPETFVDSDRLLISRVTRRGPDGSLLDGRSLEKPEEFRLVRVGTACAIAHLRTGRRLELPDCQCVELPGR